MNVGGLDTMGRLPIRTSRILGRGGLLLAFGSCLGFVVLGKCRLCFSFCMGWVVFLVLLGLVCLLLSREGYKDCGELYFSKIDFFTLSFISKFLNLIIPPFLIHFYYSFLCWLLLNKFLHFHFPIKVYFKNWFGYFLF